MRPSDARLVVSVVLLVPRTGVPLPFCVQTPPANVHGCNPPPLSAYPKSERITYLYYLGKFNYVMGHFPRAHLILQEAYDLCHSSFLSQRRKILTLLVVSNPVGQ